MYQPLIWLAVAGDDARRLGPPLDTEDGQRLADALVDGMGRDIELGGDFLGRQMLVDQAQAIELARGQSSNAFGEFARSHCVAAPCVVRGVIRFLQCMSQCAPHISTPLPS